MNKDFRTELRIAEIIEQNHIIKLSLTSTRINYRVIVAIQILSIISRITSVKCHIRSGYQRRNTINRKVIRRCLTLKDRVMCTVVMSVESTFHRLAVHRRPEMPDCRPQQDKSPYVFDLGQGISLLVAR